MVVLLIAASASLRDRLDLRRIALGPVVGTVAAAVAMWASRDSLPLALATGTACYCALLLLVERLVFPQDFAILRTFARRLQRRLGVGTDRTVEAT